VTDLTGFFAARLDEAQRRAESMQHEPDTDDTYYNCPATRTEPRSDLPWGEDACDCGLAGRKARALREVEADRKLLAAYAEVAHMDHDEPEPEYAFGRAEGLGEAVRLRAARFSDHPDYRQEWRP
jgi:Family of unknown function (DUF6221)